MNSINETLENILKTLVSQASSPKEDFFQISEGLDICDFKHMNLKSNITKDTLKTFTKSFDKEIEFDIFKRYLENLLGFFEENSNSFSKQRYNNLLLFMLISQTKQTFSYKLLENFNNNLIGKYRISFEENMILMSIIFNLVEVTQNLLQKNIELNKNNNENNLLTHQTQRLTLNRNVTSKFSHSRCSGKIEKFITKNSQKLYKLITPKNDIDKHFIFKHLKSENETIYPELKTEQESVDFGDKIKPFFDKLFENLENFISLKEYVILSHDLSNKNMQFMKELSSNFNEFVNKKFEEGIINIKFDTPKSYVKANVPRESKNNEYEKIFKSNKNSEKPTKIKSSDQKKHAKKDSLNKSINKSSNYLISQHNQTLNTQEIINTSQHINNSLTEKQKGLNNTKKQKPVTSNQNDKSSYEGKMSLKSFSKASISKLAKLNFSKENPSDKKKGDNHRIHKSSLDYSEIFSKNDGNLSTHDYIPLNKKQSRSFILDDNFNSNFVLPSEDPVKNIHNYISEYANIGGATKKFDGISVKKRDNEVTVCFEGGLNAKNKINSPCHEKIKENINGDNSLPNDDSLVTYR